MTSRDLPCNPDLSCLLGTWKALLRPRGPQGDDVFLCLSLLSFQIPEARDCAWVPLASSTVLGTQNATFAYGMNASAVAVWLPHAAQVPVRIRL